LAEIVRIEPSKFCAGEAWFVFDDGTQRLRKIDRPAPVARSDFPAPMIRRDSIDPTRGMDGKMHDSLASYRRSLRADGNPQGENYIELGNESLTPVEHKFDPKQRRDDIKSALADVKAGKPIPEPVFLGDAK
jgi:hypothetical protein